MRQPGGKKLAKLEGVEATVNLPLETAHVTVPAGITDQQITDQVASAGYKARIKNPASPANDGGAGMRKRASKMGPRRQGTLAELARRGSRWGGTSEHSEHGGPTEAPEYHEDHMAHGGKASELKPRLLVAAVLAVPVFLISMFPAFQFPNWGWVAGALALPVVSWAAWPFHKAAAINARHLASTMDTLVSLGVTAAYLFSAWQLLADPRLTEHPGMEQMGGAGTGGLYFEVASVVTTFLLLGRFLEANAKAKAGDALRALLDLGAKDATIVQDGAEVKIPASRLAVGT